MLLIIFGIIMLCSCGENDASSDDAENHSESDTAVSDSAEDSGESDDSAAGSEGKEETETDESGLSSDDDEDIDTSKIIPEIKIKELVHENGYNIYVPEFLYPEQSGSIDVINTGLENFEKAYEIIKKKHENSGIDGGVECRTFCFSNIKYVTAVISWKELPDDMTDGSVYSYVYDVQNERYYRLKRAMADYEITEEDVQKKFESWYSSKVNKILSSKVDAFRITASDSLELYLSAKFSDGTSRIFIYNHTTDMFTPFSNDELEAAEAFETYTALTPYTADAGKTYTLDGKEYTEAELLSIANHEYMAAYCVTAYLFGGKGDYGTETKTIDGNTYYKSEKEGFETFDAAMNSLNEYFLFPEEYFKDNIEKCLYKDTDGTLWIREDKSRRKCVSTGVSGVDSVMESLMIFTTCTEYEGKTAVSDYFTLIFSNGSYKCTYFTYPE